MTEGEVVRFVQSVPEAIVLNRVTGAGNPGEIAGRIDANGQVILVNSQGVTLSESFTTSVGGLIVSELDVSPQDFMLDSFVFSNRANHFTMGSAGSAMNISSVISTAGTYAATSLRVEAGGNVSLMNLVLEGVSEMSFVADGNIWISRSRLGALKHWVEFVDNPFQYYYPRPTWLTSIEAGRNVAINQSEF